MAPVEMYMRWADLVTVWEVLYMSNFIQNWNWWEVLYMSNLIQTLYLRSCGKFWRQRWMLHSKLDTGNKLSTQTPSSAQWMGTRGHLKSAFTCVVIWISGASSHNCSYNDFGINLHLMNRQIYFLVFGARTGFTFASMKSKHYSQGGRGYQQIRDW